MPNDYAEQLRRRLEPKDMDDDLDDNAHHLIHRVSSISNSSEMSFRNSARGSDSEITESVHGEVDNVDVVTGSRYLQVNPDTSFEEMMEKAKTMQEVKAKEMKDPLENGNGNRTKSTPGCQNSFVTLMI